MMKEGGREGLPPEAREALARAGADLAEISRDASRQVAETRIAPENGALFKKYETELKKYAMPGLNMLLDERTERASEGTGGKRP
jgi:hypothetical protein